MYICIYTTHVYKHIYVYIMTYICMYIMIVLIFGDLSILCVSCAHNLLPYECFQR